MTSTTAVRDGWLWLGVALSSGVAAWLVLAMRRMLVTARALAPMPGLSRRLSKWVKARDRSEDQLLRADGAPDAWVERRRAGLDRLASLLESRYAVSTAWGRTIREGFSDLRFTDASRVPFPFARVMREKFNVCSVVTES